EALLQGGVREHATAPPRHCATAPPHCPGAAPVAVLEWAGVSTGRFSGRSVGGRRRRGDGLLPPAANWGTGGQGGKRRGRGLVAQATARPPTRLDESPTACGGLLRSSTLTSRGPRCMGMRST